MLGYFTSKTISGIEIKPNDEKISLHNQPDVVHCKPYTEGKQSRSSYKGTLRTGSHLVGDIVFFDICGLLPNFTGRKSNYFIFLPILGLYMSR